MRKESSNAPSVDPPFPPPYVTPFTSNEFTPLPLHDNPYDPQDSVPHFPFLPPDCSSLLPFMDTHNTSFFNELESLATNTAQPFGDVGDCPTKACVNYSNDDKNSVPANDDTGSWKVGGGDIISWPCGASMRKGVRSKRRSPRKNCRWFARLTRKKFLALSSVRPYKIAATATAPRTQMSPQEPHIVNEKLKLLLRKELKNSDVSSLGRVIIPKKDAEEHLPPLASKEGIRIKIKDMDSSQTWNMKYRYWPNNKSRMYVLQNARDFIRMYRLRSGDFMLLYHDQETGEYLISARKAQNHIECVSNRDGHSNTDKDDEVVFLGANETSLNNISEHGSGGDVGGGHRCNSNIGGGGGGGDTEIMIQDSTSIAKEGVAGGNTIDDGVGSCTSTISCITHTHDWQISSLERFDSINDCDLSFCDDVLEGTPINYCE